MCTEKTPFKKLLPSRIRRGDILQIESTLITGLPVEYLYSVVLRVPAGCNPSLRYFSYFTTSVEGLHKCMPCAIPFPFYINSKSGKFVEETGVFARNYRIKDVQVKAGYSIAKKYADLRKMAISCSRIPQGSFENKITEILRGMPRKYEPEEIVHDICEKNTSNIVDLEAPMSFRAIIDDECSKEVALEPILLPLKILEKA